VKKFRLEKRINDKMIVYGRKKKSTNSSKIIENIHFITLFKSEKVFTLKDNIGYQITTNEGEMSISINNERKSIEKEINFLRRKMDRFRIWKEKNSNMEEITNILDLKNMTYAIQLKENNYLLWKFKRKWKLIAEINTRFNLAKMEYMMINRKKKRRRINILTNLFDVTRNIIMNTGLNMVINKGNLYYLIKLHKTMHNNNRYFDSIYDKKFQFYSQLIKRYRQF
jgi:hypothetical protein